MTQQLRLPQKLSAISPFVDLDGFFGRMVRKWRFNRHDNMPMPTDDRARCALSSASSASR